MTINMRLKILRKTLNLNQSDIANRLDIALSSYQNYERGERSIPSDVIEKILKDFSVNSSWLFENSGNMFKDNVEIEIDNLVGYPKWGKIKANIGKRITDAYKIAGKNHELELLQNWLSQADINEIIQGSKLPNNMILEGVIRDTGVPKAFLEGHVPHPQLGSISLNDENDFVQVPLFDDIFAAAGVDGTATKDKAEIRHLVFRNDWLKKMRFSSAHLSLVHIEGNSMAPTLQNNDIVLIDHSQTDIRPDRIIVAVTKNMVYIRRIQSMADGQLTLKCDNADYPPFVMDVSDKTNRISGRVVWIARCL